jgi:hypothetical protein
MGFHAVTLTDDREQARPKNGTEKIIACHLLTLMLIKRAVVKRILTIKLTTIRNF